MTPHVEDATPVPVEPLPYEGPDGAGRTALAGVARGVAWFVVLRAGVTLAMYCAGVTCFLWESGGSTPLARQMIGGVPLVVSAPLALLAVASLGGGLACLRFREAGRKWVVVAATADATCAPIVSLFDGVYNQHKYQYLRYSLAFAAYHAASLAGGAVYTLVVCLAVRAFFRYPPVRRLFPTDRA